LKALKQKIEGVDGDGAVTGWMNDWILTRNEKISEEDLYDSFIEDYPMESFSWDSRRFHKGFFDFVMEHPDYDFNAHRSHKGDKKSDRRWYDGAKHQQKLTIVVTVKGVKPIGKSKTSNGSTDTLNVGDHEHLFERLAS
jgi:hypothetical protein